MSSQATPEMLRRGSDAEYTPVELFEAVPSYACQRRSPRPCVNQDLVDALEPLRQERFVLFGSESAHICTSYYTSANVVLP